MYFRLLDYMMNYFNYLIRIDDDMIRINKHHKVYLTCLNNKAEPSQPRNKTPKRQKYLNILSHTHADNCASDLARSMWVLPKFVGLLETVNC